MSIVGRLGAAPEAIETSSGRTLVKYSIASNSGKSDARKTSWFKVASFVDGGPQREYLMGLGKG